MIKELIVAKSGREGTLFESGEKIPYSEMVDEKNNFVSRQSK